MKKKIIGFFVLLGVITTTVSAAPLNIQNDQTRRTQYQATLFDWGVDQQHTENCGHGIILTLPWTYAQRFTPTKDKLTAVRLNIFKYGTPPAAVHLTVSIRDNLNGSDLTITTIDTSQLNTPKDNWILFDFQDITLTPGDTYFILCSGDGGNETNAWCWVYNNEDTYPMGEAWVQPDASSPWSNFTHGGYNPDDFCFKTYFRKPLSGAALLPYGPQRHPLVLSLHERFPHAFPILWHLMGC